MRRRLFDADVSFDLVFGIKTAYLAGRSALQGREDSTPLSTDMPPHDETFGTGVAYLARRLKSIYRLLGAARYLPSGLSPFKI